MTKILACLDASPYAEGVCDLSAWASRRLSAPVEILHVLQRKSAVPTRNDLTGAIGLGVKSDLLEELTRMEEMESRIAIQAGRALLEAAAQRLEASGVTDVKIGRAHV